MLIERAVKTSTQIFFDKGLFDKYNNGNADKVLKNNLLIEVNERRRPDLEEVNDVNQ